MFVFRWYSKNLNFAKKEKERKKDGKGGFFAEKYEEGEIQEIGP